MEENKKEILMKNNNLIRAKYNLKVVENKVFQFILFNLQKQNKDTLVANIKLNEFSSIIKKRNNRTVKAISDMLEELRVGSIQIKNDKKWLRYGFINGATYDEELREFKIKADAEIYRLLFNYLKGYTPVNLDIFFSFKSYYTQRFYELLRLWSNSKHTITYSLEELKELLILKDKYSLYKDFKKRVLIVSINELNKKGMMEINFNEIKIGKKVTAIEFIITDSDKRKYFEEDKKQNKPKENYPKNNLKFNNFDQREYDYDDLEKKLLGWDENDDE